MKWTPEQKEFLESEESTLFVGGRQVGKTEVLIDKAKRLYNDGEDIVVVAPYHRHLREIKNRLGYAPNVEYATSGSHLQKYTRRTFIVEEYGMCENMIPPVRGTIYATTTTYDYDVGQFSNCVTSFNGCHFHNSDYAHSRAIEQHYGLQFNGHSILFDTYKSMSSAKCTICDTHYTFEGPWFSIMMMFGDECLYRNI